MTARYYLKTFILTFSPMLWMPIVNKYPEVILKQGRGFEKSLYAFYCNYSPFFLMAAIGIGLLFSLYHAFKTESKIKYLYFFLVGVSVPIQAVFYIVANTQVFGK